MRATPLLLILLLVPVYPVSASLAAGNSEPWSPQKTGRPHARPVAATVARDGGETIGDAVAIPALPYTDSGQTTGAVDDYTEHCPLEDSGSPDVVYAYTPAAAGAIAIDLCGSDYDTKVIVYDDGQNLVACNDDFYLFDDAVCGSYVSKIEYLEVAAGTTYYIVIDGYDGDAGNYELAVAPAADYELECASGARVEGEPPLDGSGDDVFNSGCSTGGLQFQTITGGLDGILEICQVAGWNDAAASNIYDVDWLVATMGPGGILHGEFDADWTIDCRVFVPDDCFFLDELQQARGGRGVPGVIDLEAAPGTVFWLYFAPASTGPPIPTAPYMFDYVLEVSGLEPAPAANEAMGWGAVKSLYR
ncbi:MAG: hypothetical protein IPM94_16685 [bacterium]|nr:hypothetical protein [bacterium]